MPNVVKRIVGFPFRFGGIEHSGWLPPGAARPLATPIHDVLLDLTIEGTTGTGYVLYYQSQDGKFCSDTWYQSIADAEEAATDYFGITADRWKNMPNST